MCSELYQTANSSLASPDSESTPNSLVLVAHNIQGDLARLEEMKISKSKEVQYLIVEPCSGP